MNFSNEKGDYSMKKKTLKYSVSVAVLSAMMAATPTFASPVTKGQIALTQSQINDLETKVQQLDNQVIIGMEKSQKLDNAIKAQQVRIEKTKVDIIKAQQDLNAHKQIYSDRLRSYQSQGQPPIITYAELLLSSQNLSEFLTRTTAVTQILQSDTDLMNGLNEKQQVLTNAQQQLHNELDKLTISQNDLAAEQKNIEAAKQEVETELASSKSVLQQQQSQMAKQQAEQAQLARVRAQQIAQQIAQQTVQQHSSVSNGSVSVPSSGGATNSAKASEVIAVAEQYLGVPYVWGGSSPRGFDCSGLMQYSFRSIGVYLPRTAAQQQNVGTRISPSQVQPGDLVFMGDPAYHVGMYIGNGQWIEAPETGDVVKIVPYNPGRFSSAARVLQ